MSEKRSPLFASGITVPADFKSVDQSGGASIRTIDCEESKT
jgi:hypothetical protein